MEATYPFDAVVTTTSTTCWRSSDVYGDAVGKEAREGGAAWVWPMDAQHRFFAVTVEMSLTSKSGD